ncbi:MAG: hypothetical protein Fur0035_10120 [Anaerolineales bacterium]
MNKSRKLLVIGAGIGGLTAAALLLQQGWQVTVLEAGTYPGGCAATFSHKGYRFEAGATLAGGFDPAGPHSRVAEILGLTWPVTPITNAAWVTHLAGMSIHQWVEPARWRDEYLTKFPFSARFWQKQEQLAKIAWELSARGFPWPPATLSEAARLPLALRPQALTAAPYLFRKMRQLLPRETTPQFKAFVDGNLLISAQAVSGQADALYGSSVLDLPRRGVMRVQGGMGAIAETLVAWIKANGGEVKYRQRVTRLETAHGRVRAALTAKEMRFEADVFLANLTPWALENLLGEAAPRRLRSENFSRPEMWGAFVVHAAFGKEKIMPAITHHQVIVDVNQPLGEGNSVFISFLPEEKTAILSTHVRARLEKPGCSGIRRQKSRPGREGADRRRKRLPRLARRRPPDTDRLAAHLRVLHPPSFGHGWRLPADFALWRARSADWFWQPVAGGR